MMIPVLSLPDMSKARCAPLSLLRSLYMKRFPQIGQPNILPGELSKGLIFSAARGLGKEHRCVKMLVL